MGVSLAFRTDARGARRGGVGPIYRGVFARFPALTPVVAPDKRPSPVAAHRKPVSVSSLPGSKLPRG